jgi:hypothetical protein
VGLEASQSRAAELGGRGGRGWHRGTNGMCRGGAGGTSRGEKKVVLATVGGRSPAW